MKRLQPQQQEFLKLTSQDFEDVILGIPVKPLPEVYGNIFASQPGLREGGHMVLTTTRLIYCPKRLPGSWVWHFANLSGISVQASLLKSVIMLSHDGLDHRWQTLKKGANLVMNAWTDWRTHRKDLFNYPAYTVRRPNAGKRIRCVKCTSPLPEEVGTANQVSCFACNSQYRIR